MTKFRFRAYKKIFSMLLLLASIVALVGCISNIKRTELAVTSRADDLTNDTVNETSEEKSVESMKLSLLSSLDFSEKPEFQYGELPVYLRIIYTNSSGKPIDVVVQEYLDGIRIETDYQLFSNGEDEAIDMYVMVAKNVSLPVGEYKIKVVHKNENSSGVYDNFFSDEVMESGSEDTFGEISLKIVEPTNSIARDGQNFTTPKNEQVPFIAVAGLTNIMTNDNVPISNVTDLITGDDYYIYFTIGNATHNGDEDEDLFVCYNIYSSEDEDLRELIYSSDKKSIKKLKIDNMERYFSSFIPLNSNKQMEELLGSGLEEMYIEVLLIDSETEFLHSCCMKVKLQKPIE